MSRRLAASIAANTRWSRENPTEQGRKMRAGLEAKFLREVDPDGVLPEDERNRRAEAARRAHYQRMALASAKARSERKAWQEVTAREDIALAWAQIRWYLDRLDHLSDDETETVRDALHGAAQKIHAAVTL